MDDDGVHQNPIFRLRAGDRLLLTLLNEQPLTSEDMNLPPMDECGSPVSTQTSSNIHFHGTHVSPHCHQDEVVKTIVNAGQTFLFNYTIPDFQPPGLLWWHPHTYPSAMWQIAGGATGVFVIDGIDAVQPLVRGVPERILVFRSEPNHRTSFANPPSEDISLNFIPIIDINDGYTPPTYAIKPGEV